MLMVTVMGPSVARYLAMSGNRRCHQSLPILCPLLSAHGCLSLPHPHPSISVYIKVCLALSWSVSDPHPFPHPMPVQVSTPLALISQSGSMMKSWIQATFLCSLARHLRVLTFPWYG